MYYVTMTDSFMSGWGQARGLTNKLVFLCETAKEACVVYRNALARGDQKYVSISYTKPRYYRSTKGDDYVVGRYYVQNKTKQEYDSWYIDGYFRK